MAALTNKALEDPAANKTALVGPTYSYIDEMPKPGGVGDRGDFGQIFTNVNAMSEYVDYIGWSKRALGDSYFTNTGGMCVAPSGKLEQRYTYVNNKPPESGTSYNILGKGLAGGIVSDVASMNPVTLLSALKANATPACRKYKCDVTNPTNGTAQYLTPSLTPDFSPARCKIVPESKDPDADVKAEIDRLKKLVAKLKDEAAADPEDTSIKKEIQKKQDQLTTLLEDQTSMASRRKEYPSLAKEDPVLSRETFELMNSPMLGGVLMAGILLAVLALRR